MTEPSNKCDWHSCNRPYTRVGGWGNAFCEGHMIVGEANADTHGEGGISPEEYTKELIKAKQWLKDNPNPVENDGEET